MSSEKISSEIYKRFNRKLSSGLIRRYRRKFGRSFNLTLITLNKLDLLIIITFLILAGYVYRRLRKSPYLTDYNKLLRLEWCLKHRNTDFSKFIFVDETTIRLWNYLYIIGVFEDHAQMTFHVPRNLGIKSIYAEAFRLKEQLNLKLVMS